MINNIFKIITIHLLLIIQTKIKVFKKDKSEKAGSVMFWFGIALFAVAFAASKFL